LTGLDWQSGGKQQITWKSILSRKVPALFMAIFWFFILIFGKNKREKPFFLGLEIGLGKNKTQGKPFQVNFLGIFIEFSFY